MKNPEMLRLVPGHLIKYVPDQYKTQQMLDKVILENGGTLESVPVWYKTQEMCDKAVDNYAYALEIVSDYYNAQKCVIQPSILILLQFDFFLNAIRLLKFMVKLL